MAELSTLLSGLGVTAKKQGLLVDPSFNPTGVLNSARSMADQQYTYDTSLNNIFRDTASLDSQAGLATDRIKSDLTSRVNQLRSQYGQNQERVSNQYAQNGMLYSGNYLKGQTDLGQNFVQGINDLNQGSQRSLEDIQRASAERKNQLEQEKMKQEKELADSKANAELQRSWMDSQTQAMQSLITSREQQSAQREQQMADLIAKYESDRVQQQYEIGLGNQYAVGGGEPLYNDSYSDGGKGMISMNGNFEPVTISKGNVSGGVDPIDNFPLTNYPSQDTGTGTPGVYGNVSLYENYVPAAEAPLDENGNSMFIADDAYMNLLARLNQATQTVPQQTTFQNSPWANYGWNLR